MENPELHDDKSQDVPPRVVDINQPGLFRLPVIVTHYDTEQSILQFKSYSGREYTVAAGIDIFPHVPNPDEHYELIIDSTPTSSDTYVAIPLDPPTSVESIRKAIELTLSPKFAQFFR